MDDWVHTYDVEEKEEREVLSPSLEASADPPRPPAAREPGGVGRLPNLRSGQGNTKEVYMRLPPPIRILPP